MLQRRQLVPRDALFDAAVNKALNYALRLGLPLGDGEKLRGGLELWYLKTRFAYRVPFGEVLAVLAGYPEGTVLHRWQGGRAGVWTSRDEGDPPR